MYGFMHMSADAQGIWKRTLDPLGAGVTGS